MSADFQAGWKRYCEAFPDEDVNEIMHTAWIFTDEALAALEKAISRGSKLTCEEIDRDYGPFSWDW